MSKNLIKIADYLILYSYYLQDVGLYHGKMGIVISLYLYSRQAGDNLMCEYAWELLQQVYHGIHENMPVGIENGLAGIGYGTLILSKYGLVKCDLNEVLIDIDKKIMERDPRRMTDNSFRNGIEGIRFYINKRLTFGYSLLTFDDQYLEELNYKSLHQSYYPTDIISLITEPTFSIKDYVGNPLGIDGGSAYYLLKSAIYD